MNTDQSQQTDQSHPVASMQRSGIEEPYPPNDMAKSFTADMLPLTLEQRVENLERQVASIVRAGAANIMAARGADKAPGAGLRRELDDAELEREEAHQQHHAPP